MAEAKFFNNNIIGQYVLTRVPVKVYVEGRFLTITDIDDIEDPLMGFGMDENGAMKHFTYTSVEHLLIHGNQVTIDTYNKGMAAAYSSDEGEGEAEGEEKEEPKEDEEEKGGIFGKKKEESFSKLGDLISEASKEEVDAEVEGAEAKIDAAKAKTKAASAAEKETVKKAKEKIKAAQAQPIDDGVIKEHNYTFGVGDIVKNKNTSCPHHGSMGVVKKLMKLANNMGTVAIYTVMNQGATYRPGDTLTKTIDQLEPIQKSDGVE